MNELKLIMCGGALLTAVVFALLLLWMWRENRRIKRELAEGTEKLANCRQEGRRKSR